MQLDSQTGERTLRVWALIGARAGDNDQVIALAEALQIPFEIKQLEYGGLRLLGPRLLGRSLISLTKSSRNDILSEPPPDLTISAGHRSVPAVQALRHRSRGRMRAIHVGFPRISPAHFDLVVATPQYAIPDHPNLLRMPYALTRAATSETAAIDIDLLDTLPRPISLLIVGGPSLYWTIDRPALLSGLRELLNAAAKSGGSVLVTSSPRTPPTIRNEINAILAASKVPSMLATPGQAPRYSSMLEAADSILVTADSVAMVSDAIWTGKPVSLINVARTGLGRLAMGIGDLLRPNRPLYPQDLRWFWEELRQIGVSEEPALPQTSTRREMDRLLARVQPIIEGLDHSAPN